MDTCVIDNFEKVCRICMKFDKTFLSITSFKIIDMIIACTSVQIWENDDLPNQICHACFLQLQNIINFKQLCEDSDNAFREIIQQKKINLSNNQNAFNNYVKDEEFDDYVGDNSLIDIKEEDISENVSNENSFENEKIRIVQNEDDTKKSETNNILEIKNVDRPKFNKIKTQSKPEKNTDKNENIKKHENMIENFTCEKCNKEFKKLWVLGQHMHRKHRAKALKCNNCELKFHHPLHLKEHQELTHNPLNLTCNICNKVFKDIYKLKEHKLIHTDHRLPCDRCDKLFRDKRALKYHNNVVHLHLEKHVTCHVCGKSITKKNIHHHLATHKEREKLTCEKCFKTFISQLTLKNHTKQIHENQTPARNHLCNICGHALRSAPQLRIHLLTHTNERPYACEHCDKTYRRPDKVKDHISRVHLNQRKFQCTFCPQAFFDKRTFVHHVRRHTGEKPHICEVCDKRFIQKIALQIHMKIHSNSRENLTQRLG